ncbi:TPA: type IV conjugative transfer system pilin TraA [Citrobacter koseri]|nr:type IV conjugative transfer system pilin TraA [Citrobacter koseri]
MKAEVINNEGFYMESDSHSQASRHSFFVFSIILAVMAVTLFFVTGSTCNAEDLLKSGDQTVTDTVGEDSSVIRWLLILEVLAAILSFIATKNLKVLGGIIALSIFINIAFVVIG